MFALLRFLRGYLRICVYGYAPERFMNLCSVYGICLWDIEDVYVDAVSCGEGNESGKMMNIAISDFFRLRAITRKTKTRVHIVKRLGFPFFLKKTGQHKVFVGGLFICLISLYMLSKFIWTIEITGNTELTQDIFQDFLKKQNVCIGMRIDEFDIDSFEKAIRNEYDYITWASARIIGTRLVVSVKENSVEKLSDMEKVQAPTDLVANLDGVIVSMITRNGVPMKKIGDTVTKGEILVSGRIPILNDDETTKGWHECHADADVVIETTKQFETSMKFVYIDKKPTGNVHTRWGLKIGDTFLELGKKMDENNWEGVQEYEQLKIMQDFYLPVYYGKTVYTEYVKNKAEYSEDELKNLLLEKYNLYEQSFLEKGVQIVKKDVKIVRKKDEMVLKGKVKINIKIGKSVPSETTGINTEYKEETEVE